MKKRCSIVIVAMLFTLFGIFLGITVGYIYFIFNYGELGSKPMYAKLQSFSDREIYNPPYTLTKEIVPVFVKSGILHKNKPYNLLGIPTRDEAFPYFWIVTNVEDKAIENVNHVYFITAGKKFYLPCNFLNDLEQHEKFAEAVHIYLHDRCITE